MDDIARFFLNFSHLTFIIPLIFLGLIWGKNRIFQHAALLLLFGILLNVALKGTFKIPLASWMQKEGFAFPSGHMQASVVFYGWLMSQYRYRTFQVISLVLLGGIAWGLIYFGYHNLLDVFGAVVVASLLLWGYRKLLQYPPKSIFITLLLSMHILMLYNAMQYVSIPKHAFMAYYALLGFLISDYFLPSKTPEKALLFTKIVATISILGIEFLMWRHLLPLFENLPPYLSQSPWFLMTAWIPLASWILCTFQMDSNIR